MAGQKDDNIKGVGETILGFPEFFIAATRDASQKSGAIISFRAGEPPRLYKGFRVSPKPASLKIRTCSAAQGIEMLRGYVAVHQGLFGRAGNQLHGEEDALRWVQKDLIAQNKMDEASKFSAVPLKVTRDEIISGAAGGMYSLFASDKQKNEKTFTVPAASNNEFIHPEPDRRSILFRVCEAEKKHNDVLINVDYALPKMHFSSLDIIAYEGFPVTGDADMLAVATPLSAAKAMEGLLGSFPSADLYKAYNTADLAELRELVVMYLLIRHAMDGKPIPLSQIGEQEVRVIMESAAVKSSGIITPYELLVLMMSHEKLAHSYTVYAPGSEDLIRHGAESCNPGKPSNLDMPMLHIKGNKIYITRNESELVQFYLQPGILEKNFLPVHPRWNMALWSPVIQRQIELGQMSLIGADTLKNYRAWAAKHHEVKKTADIFLEMGHLRTYTLPDNAANPARGSANLSTEHEKNSVQSQNDAEISIDVFKKAPR